jgi:hypothetical protein
MKNFKLILTVTLIFGYFGLNAQVGIGTQTPSAKSILDLTSTNKGFLLPRMTTTERTGIAPDGTTDKGMQVFDTTTNSIWFWNGALWIEQGSGGSGDNTNDAFVNNTTGTRVELGTKSNGAARNTGTEFVIQDAGNVGIGTVNPDNSAILHLDVTSLPANGKKGFLGPKVALTSATDQATIPSPAVGLMVYNLGTGGLSTPGYLFWNGSEWRMIDNSTTVIPSISSLQCSEARLQSPYYTVNSAYSGLLIVPYTNGNGGSYSAGSDILSSGVTGLTAKLKAGTLQYGSGELVFDVTGMPIASSPNTASFNIPAMFGASGCTATVGSGLTLGIGASITANYIIPTSTTTSLSFNLGTYVTANGLTPLPRIDGIEANLQGHPDIAVYAPRIYNRLTSTQVISYQTFATQVNQNKTAINLSLTSNNFDNVDADTYCYWASNAAEVITTNVQVAINATTFRWYEFKWWCMQVGSNKIIFIKVTRTL